MILLGSDNCLKVVIIIMFYFFALETFACIVSISACMHVGMVYTVDNAGNNL